VNAARVILLPAEPPPTRGPGTARGKQRMLFDHAHDEMVWSA